MLAEGGYVFLCPCPMAWRFQFDSLGGADRIVGSHTNGHGIIHDCGKPLSEVASRRWRVGHVVNQFVNVARLETGNRCVAMLGAEPVEHAAINSLRRCRQRFEFQRAIIAEYRQCD
ncbi:hypothetical protein ACG873_07310 [Mesorhizobium sp. AaZ16]|uniref:hypothetical protein n=1 Tax=Mesorhizobium sp. AaZ16 TaxID=3402289 RepID=UPI00374EA938